MNGLEVFIFQVVVVCAIIVAYRWYEGFRRFLDEIWELKKFLLVAGLLVLVFIAPPYGFVAAGIIVILMYLCGMLQD